MSERTPFKTALRDTLCGSLRAGHVGSPVRLGGWVHRRRDLGGLVFIDLRDRAGIVQVSFDPAYADAQTMDIARSLGSESVILVTGEAEQARLVLELETRGDEVELAHRTDTYSWRPG